MKLDDFDYRFPKELIAQYPLPGRDSSRLLVLKKSTHEIEHRTFSQIGDYLRDGDTLVLNDTQVIPARLRGRREGSSGSIEVLLLERLGESSWKALVKPARRAKPGTKLRFDHGLQAEVTDIGQAGEREVRFNFKGDISSALGDLAEIPLPPYIKRPPIPLDLERYQTVYARKKGAVAAPTAGLHFTKGLLSKLSSKGIKLSFLTLHVNYATFRPVIETDITKHRMHSEYFELSPETADVIDQAKKNRKQIVAVGTTSCRVLESVANGVRRPSKSSGSLESCRASSRGSGSGVRPDPSPVVKPMKGWTDLFIYPPYEFKVVDMLLTNFHLPRTTLLMLVSAFCGRELLLRAYQEAIERRYRFFSYGDAMLII